MQIIDPEVGGKMEAFGKKRRTRPFAGMMFLVVKENVISVAWFTTLAPLLMLKLEGAMGPSVRLGVMKT